MWELARLGYTAQGNEFSLFMLIVSNFILNKTAGVARQLSFLAWLREWSCKELSHVCYPFIHQLTNHRSYEDVVRAVAFPDADPAQLPADAALSVAAGDFLEVYGKAAEAGAWDAVASVFFIDTAHNPIDYINRIHEMLKPGTLKPWHHI